MVGRDHAEGLRGQARPRLGGHQPVLAELADDAPVLGRIGRGRDARRVAGGRPEERRTADVDHLDRLVDADQLDPDRRCERLHVDDDDVDRDDALRLELLHLAGHVAAGQDPGVDRVVEGLDLAADRGLAVGQVGDRRDLDAVAGEVLARAIGRIDLDIEGTQFARQRGDPIAVGD